jgi:lipopolysaccharide cholinephosphotransferase
MSTEPVTLRQLQLAELEIMREFQRVCMENSLRYYVLGGTLLGAVRHQAFIPWDDDVDVGMPRPDYERLSAIADRVFADGYALQSRLTEPAYPFMFAKLLDTRTHLVDRATAGLAIRHCVSIDVFPLDGTPERGTARKVHQWALRWCKLRLGAEFPRGRLGGYLARASRLAPRSWAAGLSERFARRYPYDRSATVVNPGGAWGYERESVSRSWFGEGAALPFEGLTVIGPKEWGLYLTHIYGDFMRLPPEEQRTSTHTFTGVTLRGAADR